MPALPPAGSLGWLADEYFKSVAFLNLDPQSRNSRIGVIEACLEEPLSSNSPLRMGSCPATRVDVTHVRCCVLAR
jgi:hypothetical protein